MMIRFLNPIDKNSTDFFALVRHSTLSISNKDLYQVKNFRGKIFIFLIHIKKINSCIQIMNIVMKHTGIFESLYVVISKNNQYTGTLINETYYRDWKVLSLSQVNGIHDSNWTRTNINIITKYPLSFYKCFSFHKITKTIIWSAKFILCAQ